eukprot:1164880-Prymnesium_polylepis.2
MVSAHGEDDRQTQRKGSTANAVEAEQAPPEANEYRPVPQVQRVRNATDVCEWLPAKAGVQQR